MLQAICGNSEWKFQAKTGKEDNWRNVPCVLNPAEDVFRGIQTDEITRRWFKGLDILSCPITRWPNERIEEVKDEREENIMKLCEMLMRVR